MVLPLTLNESANDLADLVKAEVPRQSVGEGKLIQQRTRVRYPLLKTTALRGNGLLATRS